MNIILLSLLCVAPLFGSEYGRGYQSSQVARFEPAPMMSKSTFDVGLTNWSAPLSHNSMRPEMQEKMAHANKLFHAGDKPGLLQLHGELSSFGKKFNLFASDYYTQASYVKSLINSEHLGLFIRLNQAPKSEVKAVLHEIFDSTPDLTIKAEALIAADQLVGGIICEYGGEFQLDMTGHEPTDMMVTTRLGSYQIEKLLPEKGTTPDKAMTERFVQAVMQKADSMPESLRNDFIQGAIQGFMEAAVDPGRITKENLTIAKEVSVTLFDTFLGYHIRSKEYGDQRTQQIDKYAKSIDNAFKNYNSKDWGHLAGESAVRALHGYGYYVGGRWVLNQASGPSQSVMAAESIKAIESSSVQAPATMESLLGKMIKTEVKGVNTFYKSPFEKGYEGAVKLFEALNPTNVRKIPVEIKGVKGQGIIGKLGNDVTVVVRSISSEGSAMPPTLEFQMPHPGGGSGKMFNKIRF